MGKQKITWIGHGSWKYVTASGTVLYIDPWLDDNPTCKIKLEDTKDADIVCVTHGHSDHIGTGDAIDIALQANAVFVSLPEICVYASKHGIPYDANGGAVNIGGSVKVKDCRIHCVEAQHASDIWGYEFLKDGTVIPGSGCCGYVIESEGSEPVYFAGDTGVFSDMRLIAELYQPTVAVLPVGDKYVMGPREAALAAEFINAKYLLPGHYGTTPEIEQDMDDFKMKVSVRAPRTTVEVLDPGESFEF